MTHSIAESLQKIKHLIEKAARKAGRDPAEIKIVAVSKTHPAGAIREACAEGQSIFGENKVQEAEMKIQQLRDLRVEWHLIGHLQTNKIRKALNLFDLIHSIDSVKRIQAVQKEAEKLDREVSILLQLNLAKEASKSGADEAELEGMIEVLRQAGRIRCHGLMIIPPFEENPEDARVYFRRLRVLGERYKNDLIKDGHRLELSMGMSHDFPVAIEEGATMVRIGTAIFGEREYL